MMATEIPAFYLDLNDPLFESALAVVHQRYSTNTFPSWELAQPFRYLAHNGEINTLRGNLNWMRSRERELESDLFGDDIAKLLPGHRRERQRLGLPRQRAGAADHRRPRPPPRHADARSRRRGARSTPWAPTCAASSSTTPASWSRGTARPRWPSPTADAVGALLDRNGLRPARYTITKDGFMVLASEAGVLDFPPEQVRGEGRAAARADDPGGPGADAGCCKDVEIKTRLARRQPYRRWVEENKIAIHGFFGAVAPLDARDRQPAPPPEALRLHARGHQADPRPHGRHAATSRSAPWAPTSRWRCSPRSRSCSTGTSSSSSRR